ncbi:hypothetical protein TKK_0008535 [Trichogramma kaykai]|uniref:Uncharacterized protein n=1 Tax=Trichogramma kaykai TaxID=54128 RepID=A0ABD2X5E6_9HYME
MQTHRQRDELDSKEIRTASDDEDDEDEEENEPIVTRCRICAQVLPADSLDAAICLFDEKNEEKEEERSDLQSHILKYLHIRISPDDRLTKMVCATCVDKLEMIHEFATKALESQEKLRAELSSERSSASSKQQVDDRPTTDDDYLHVARQDNKNLLHTMLTQKLKGAKNKKKEEAEEAAPKNRQRTPSTEEMEVKIDPMLFLQCALECSLSDENSELSNDYSSERREAETATDNHHRAFAIGPTSKKKARRGINKKSDFLDVDAENGVNDDDEKNFDSIEEVVDDSGDDHDSSSRSTDRRQHVCKVCAKSYGSQLALQNHLWSHLPTDQKDVEHRHNRQHRRFADVVNGSSQSSLPQPRGSDDDELASGARILDTVNEMDCFICPICGKKISTKGNLKVHLETHRPKGKHGCDICGRIFKTQSNLFRHKEYHSGVQFPCTVCGRVYPTNSTLRAHSITHSDLRPHACPLCDKTFKRNQDLKFHINQHTGARPYRCPYCPKAFASSGNCFSHRKRMHPREVNRDRQRAADLMR